MTAVYASTTFSWFQTHSARHVGERVAFWQPTPAKPHEIRPGERWYFKRLGEPEILGYGTYEGWEKCTIRELHHTWGLRSGYATLPELVAAFNDLGEDEFLLDNVVGNVQLTDFTALRSPIPLSKLDLDNLSVRFRYLRTGDPLADLVP